MTQSGKRCNLGDGQDYTDFIEIEGSLPLFVARLHVCQRNKSAFSLVELLVACAILGAILMILMSVVNHATQLWKASNSRVEAFQSARVGFENLTRLLSQATLNTYWDYDDSNAPTRYIRQSELHFLIDSAGTVFGSNHYGQTVLFQAPANYNTTTAGSVTSSDTDKLPALLNACGFFVEFASDKAKGWVPSYVKSSERKRFRLMQWIQPTSSLSIYDPASSADNRAWISANATTDASPVADNIIALIVWPKEPEKQATKVLDDSYSYDSRSNADANPQPANANQLPPIIEVAMVAIDESSASRLGDNLQATISDCLSGLFLETPNNYSTTNPHSFSIDLQTLENALIEKKITYQVFVSTVSMHEAKWSPEK